MYCDEDETSTQCFNQTNNALTKTFAIKAARLNKDLQAYTNTSTEMKNDSCRSEII